MDFSRDKSFDLSSLILLCCCSENVDGIAIAFCTLRNEALGTITLLSFDSSSMISNTFNASIIYARYLPQLEHKDDLD